MISASWPADLRHIRNRTVGNNIRQSCTQHAFGVILLIRNMCHSVHEQLFYMIFGDSNLSPHARVSWFKAFKYQTSIFTWFNSSNIPHAQLICTKSLWKCIMNRRWLHPLPLALNISVAQTLQQPRFKAIIHARQARRCFFPWKHKRNLDMCGHLSSRCSLPTELCHGVWGSTFKFRQIQGWTE